MRILFLFLCCCVLTGCESFDVYPGVMSQWQAGENPSTVK